jgi:hypothetical protein
VLGELGCTSVADLTAQHLRGTGAPEHGER